MALSVAMKQREQAKAEWTAKKADLKKAGLVRGSFQKINEHVMEMQAEKEELKATLEDVEFDEELLQEEKA